MNAELKTLLTRCIEKDEDAVNALVLRYQSLAFKIALSILKDNDLANDAVQEGFVAAFYKLKSLKNPDAFPGWFGKIIRTYAIRIAKKNKNIPTAEIDAEYIRTDSHLRNIQEKEMLEHIRKTFKTLPANKLKTATMFYLDDRSCAEIAEMIKVPQGTVKRHLHEIRIHLREKMAGLLGIENYTCKNKRKTADTKKKK